MTIWLANTQYEHSRSHGYL